MHVNHGLMRKGESEDVVEVFSNQLKANSGLCRCNRPLPGINWQVWKIPNRNVRLSVVSLSVCSKKKHVNWMVSIS